MATQFFKRVKMILDDEKVTYENNVVATLINDYFPDWRRVLNELQRYSSSGRVDVGILNNGSSSEVIKLIGHMKAKSFTDVRKWVGEHSDLETTYLLRTLYDELFKVMTPVDSAQMTLIIADYMYKAAFVADHEINNTACIAQIMIECKL